MPGATGTTRTIHVAPRAGAWIETPSHAPASSQSFPVAPRAGAWIETSLALSSPLLVNCRAPRGRVD